MLSVLDDRLTPHEIPSSSLLLFPLMVQVIPQHLNLTLHGQTLVTECQT